MRTFLWGMRSGSCAATGRRVSLMHTVCSETPPPTPDWPSPRSTGRCSPPPAPTGAPGRLAELNAFTLIRRLAKTAGIPAAGRLSPHSLRPPVPASSASPGRRAGRHEPRRPATRRYDRDRHNLDRDPAHILGGRRDRCGWPAGPARAAFQVDLGHPVTALLGAGAEVGRENRTGAVMAGTDLLVSQSDNDDVVNPTGGSCRLAWCHLPASRRPGRLVQRAQRGGELIRRRGRHPSRPRRTPGPVRIRTGQLITCRGLRIPAP